MSAPSTIELASTDQYVNGFHTLCVDFTNTTLRYKGSISLSWDQFDATGEEDRVHAYRLLAGVVASEYSLDARFVPRVWLHATVPYGGMEDDANPFKFMDPLNWRLAIGPELSDKSIIVSGTRALLDLRIRDFDEGTNVMDAVAKHTEHWEHSSDQLGLEKIVFRYMTWLRTLGTRLWATEIGARLVNGTYPIPEPVYTAVQRFNRSEFVTKLELGVRNLPAQKRRGFFVTFMNAKNKERKTTAIKYYSYTTENRRFSGSRTDKLSKKWRWHDTLSVIFDAIEVWRGTHLQDVADAGKMYIFLVQPYSDYRTDRNVLATNPHLYRDGEFFYDSFCAAFPTAAGMLENINQEKARCTSAEFWRQYLLRRICPTHGDVNACNSLGRARYAVKVVPIKQEEVSLPPFAKRARVAAFSMDE